MSGADKKKGIPGIDEATLAAYLDGGLAPREREAVEKIIAEDDIALTELASLRTLMTSVENEPVSAPDYAKVQAKNLRNVGFVRKPAPKTSLWDKLSAWLVPVPAKVAAVAVTAALAIIIVRTGVGPGENRYSDTVRSGDEPVAEAPINAGPINVTIAEPVELSWNEIAGAEKYTVRVFSDGGEIIWSEETFESNILIPADVTVRFEPGVSYEYQVEATVPFGDPVRSSLGTLEVSSD